MSSLSLFKIPCLARWMLFEHLTPPRTFWEGWECPTDEFETDCFDCLWVSWNLHCRVFLVFHLELFYFTERHFQPFVSLFVQQIFLSQCASSICRPSALTVSIFDSIAKFLSFYRAHHLLFDWFDLDQNFRGQSELFWDTLVGQPLYLVAIKLTVMLDLEKFCTLVPTKLTSSTPLEQEPRYRGPHMDPKLGWRGQKCEASSLQNCWLTRRADRLRAEGLQIRAALTPTAKLVWALRDGSLRPRCGSGEHPSLSKRIKVD